MDSLPKSVRDEFKHSDWGLENEAAKEKAWSGDLHEVSWFFFRSPEWEIIHIHRLRHPNTKYKGFVVKVSYWGIHVAYAKD